MGKVPWLVTIKLRYTEHLLVSIAFPHECFTRFDHCFDMYSDSSEESQDEIDVPVDAEQDPEEDNLDEDPENNSQGEDDQEARPVASAPYSEPGEDYALPSVRPEALSASVYDIIPTM